MKKVLYFIYFFIPLSCHAAIDIETFQEYYCSQSTNSNNLNAGSTSGSTTYWDQGGSWYSTGSYTHPGGSVSGVVPGNIASIYAIGLTTTSFIGVVTATNSVTGEILINIDSSSYNTTIIPSSVTPGIGIRVGGAWRGPNGTQTFPFGFISTGPVTTINIFPRVNFLATSSFSVTIGLTHAKAGPVRFQGYGITPGDQVLANINAMSANVTHTFSGQGNEFFDLDISSNGTSATGTMITISGQLQLFMRDVFRQARGIGVNVTTAANSFVQCQFTGNNIGNVAAGAAVSISATTGMNAFDRCLFDHNNGSNTEGIITTGGVGGSIVVINSIFAENGLDGINNQTRQGAAIISNNSFYKNGRDGLRTSGFIAQGQTVVSNNIFCANTGYGWDYIPSTFNVVAHGENNGFCTGSSSNTAGDIVGISTGIGSYEGNIYFAQGRLPWADPNKGNFNLIETEGKDAGQGTFQVSASTYSGTVAYPDIGAVQSRRKRGGYAITQ